MSPLWVSLTDTENKGKRIDARGSVPHGFAVHYFWSLTLLIPDIKKLSLSFFSYPTLCRLFLCALRWGIVVGLMWIHRIVSNRVSNLSSKSLTCSSLPHFFLAILFFSQGQTGRLMKHISLRKIRDYVNAWETWLKPGRMHCWKQCTFHFPYACAFS